MDGVPTLLCPSVKMNGQVLKASPGVLVTRRGMLVTLREVLLGTAGMQDTSRGIPVSCTPAHSPALAPVQGKSKNQAQGAGAAVMDSPPGLSCHNQPGSVFMSELLSDHSRGFYPPPVPPFTAQTIPLCLSTRNYFHPSAGEQAIISNTHKQSKLLQKNLEKIKERCPVFPPCII